MRKVTVAAILLALIVSAGAGSSSARPAQAGADLLQALPDGNAVIVVDLHRVTASSLWAAISSQEKIKSGLDKMNADISEMGINLSDIQTVALSFPSSNMDNPVIVVNGGFDQANLLTKLRASSKVKLTSEKYKNFDLYKVESTGAQKDAAGKTNAEPAAKKDDGAFAFYDARTVVVGAIESVRASIDTKTGARASITQN